jgi:hypothetical protein
MLIMLLMLLSARQTQKVHRVVRRNKDGSKYIIESSYTHVKVPYTLDEIDDHAKALGLEPVEQPDYSSLVLIQGNVLITTSDGYTLCNKRSAEVVDIHTISNAFEDLRETWVHKREEVSWMGAL